MNWAEHVNNRNAFPFEELEKYEGQHVAWSLDGTRILAGHEDPLQLNAALEAAGYRPDDYVLSFVTFESDVEGAAFGDTAWERSE